MSLNKYGVPEFVLTVNGRLIQEFGETATPVTFSAIDPKAAIRRGQGGDAVALYRKNPGKSVSVALNPGSNDSKYMQDLMNQRAIIEITYGQIGTQESATGSEGMIVNVGETGRGGMTITDDVFIMEFNKWDEKKGGAY